MSVKSIDFLSIIIETAPPITDMPLKALLKLQYFNHHIH
jgi:hypothetical protein